MTDIIETEQNDGPNPIEGTVESPSSKQKLFTSLPDMLSYIRAFQITQGSFNTGYVQDDVGFVKPDKVFILNYVS